MQGYLLSAPHNSPIIGGSESVKVLGVQGILGLGEPLQGEFFFYWNHPHFSQSKILNKILHLDPVLWGAPVRNSHTVQVYIPLK